MTSTPPINRREFVQSSIAGFAALSVIGLPRTIALGQEAETIAENAKSESLPLIELGRIGRTLPRLGFGGFPICRAKSDEDGAAVVARAIELGVRYLDTAPSYCSGTSERRIGMAVKQSGIAREEFYIATKTLQRDADGARKELEESLSRLHLEYVDAVQVHAVHSDFETVFAENSVLNGLEKARDEGLIKHIGITGHANPKYLNECIRRYEFATALVPVNPIDTQLLSFVRDFLPVAIEQNVGVIAMKVFGGGSLLRSGDVKAGELLQYALSQTGVAIAVPGCEIIDHVNEAHEAICGFDEPLDAETLAELEERVGPHQGRTSEWYKERN